MASAQKPQKSSQLANGARQQIFDTITKEFSENAHIITKKNDKMSLHIDVSLPLSRRLLS